MYYIIKNNSSNLINSLKKKVNKNKPRGVMYDRAPHQSLIFIIFLFFHSIQFNEFLFSFISVKELRKLSSREREFKLKRKIPLKISKNTLLFKI